MNDWKYRYVKSSYEERLINRAKNSHDVKKNAQKWMESKKGAISE